MRFRSEQKFLTAFSYASLTDVVLQLLIFFLLSSAFVIQTGIKVQLPRAVVGEQETRSQIIVSLTQHGAVYVNNERVEMPRLGARLSNLLQPQPDQIVIINADRTVSLQQAVEVMDIAKAVGATRFLIATEPIP